MSERGMEQAERDVLGNDLNNLKDNICGLDCSQIYMQI
jgi:hypothetical protein